MGILTVGGLFFVLMFAFFVSEGSADDAQGGVISLLTFGFFALYGIAYVLASGYYSARIRNHIFSHTVVNTVAQFSSNVGVWSLVWLRTSNILAIICSFGFAIPWVQIRTARFYANATQVAISSEIDTVIANDPSSVGALGDEAATLFDVDVALG